MHSVHSAEFDCSWTLSVVKHSRERFEKMSTYKLSYFNLRGRGELIRLVFAAAGVAYEDVRVTRDEWPALKPNTPFGQIPILEIDGKTFCQSNAIARYLARKFKLAGKTDLEELQVDMIIDCFEDIAKPVLAARFESDETRKATLQKKLSEEQLPTFLENLEKILKSNNGGDGFFVGNELTWADLAFLAVYGWIKLSGNESLIDKHSKLKALKDRVEAVPKIAAWIAKRPVTDF